MPDMRKFGGRFLPYCRSVGKSGSVDRLRASDPEPFGVAPCPTLWLIWGCRLPFPLDAVGRGGLFDKLRFGEVAHLLIASTNWHLAERGRGGASEARGGSGAAEGGV